MAANPANGTRDKVTYILRPHRPGQATFSDIQLPDGTVIRRVDEDVHRRALRNAEEPTREPR